MELLVTLGDVAVGTIRSQPDGRNEFSFLPEYLNASRRPVLGQYFEDHLTDIHRSRLHLAPFFSNLLPEGGLRELIARHAQVHPDREADLLAVLGEDLPGAIVVRRISGEVTDAEQASEATNIERGETDGTLRFSLAGAQLKFSVLYRAGTRGPTFPLAGRGGDWIAKLPSEIYEQVPENEYAMMLWAGQVGINIPEVRLIAAGDIEGLPVQIDPHQQVFLSRRFDRPTSGPRIHQEDFAQVANVRRAQRYGTMSHTSIARVVRAVSGEDDLDETIRRTAFNVLIGNGDAHLKNWSLVYPDGIQARLSPAYDLVSTVTYISTDKLALKLSREDRFDQVRLLHFERLAEKIDVSPGHITNIVKTAVQRAMAAWPSEGLEPRRAKLLRAHIERLPLLAEAG
ncbi:MAG TPA: type II toxin-antitoxin system HipA family toxin [Polyangia bacterium]|nr:type II toxin-antitoxin system HipA family toxin [Polyangia bacterium]